MMDQDELKTDLEWLGEQVGKEDVSPDDVTDGFVLLQVAPFNASSAP